MNPLAYAVMLIMAGARLESMSPPPEPKKSKVVPVVKWTLMLIGVGAIVWGIYRCIV